MSDNPQYDCDDQQRRNAVIDPTSAHNMLNGIDYLEVVDSDAPKELRQRTLLVYLLRPPAGLTSDNVRIDGGTRVSNIKVTWAYPASAIPANKLTAGEIPFFADPSLPLTVLAVRVDTAGDFSTYRLSIVQSRTNANPRADFDPRLSSVDFSFKVECPTDFDCKPDDYCPQEPLIEPEINYLARDFNSFRRLILDRFSLLMPDWNELNAADMQIMLTEVLAYAGDNLSYYLDAVTTEQYLETALHRISVRRHARLLDYYLHEGCNARAWIVFKVANKIMLPVQTKILSSGTDNSPILHSDPLLDQVMSEQPTVFETVANVNLSPANNDLYFYTWSDSECCLPRGSTRATLYDGVPDNNGNRLPLELNATGGDILIFEEIISPDTGAEADNNPAHRWAVLLTKAAAGKDPLNDTPIVEIEWADDDALPFSLCISAVIQSGPDKGTTKTVGIAHGNVALTDHGLSLVPATATKIAALTVPSDLPPVPKQGNFRPAIPSGPVTYREPLPVPFNYSTKNSARDWMIRDPRQALPVIALTDATGQQWTPHRDLLSSRQFDADFVAEVDTNGVAYLRFGDDLFGRKPLGGSQFALVYRVGNNRAGNVGADALNRLIVPDGVALGDVLSVRNPIAASGGIDPEPMERARLDAPEAFRVQERAVTSADYTDIAGRYSGIQRAAAMLRWTGSWYTEYVTVDRSGGRKVDPSFEADFERFLDRYRMAGLDLEINSPISVPVDITLDVCVKPGYRRADVEQALFEAFGTGMLIDGTRAFFNPDNFTFGQPLYLSEIYGIAMAVAGVQSVDVTIFKRYGKVANQERENGVLAVADLEIIRLDNDPNFPESGKLTLNMDGGL